MGNLEGRVAFITGASRGLGRQTAITLAQDGCKVLCVSRNLQACEKVAEEIRGMGLSAFAYDCDVADFDSVNACAKKVLEDHGKVDIVINNAGIVSDKVFWIMTPDAWSKVLDTNITGCFYVIRAFAKSMIRNDWGRIINIGSVAGLIGNPGQANYSSAKAALTGLSKAITRELYGQNITVNTVAPGYLDNELINNELSKAIIESIERQIPFKRLGTNTEVANTCLFLCQEEANYIKGTTISVDGGLGLQAL